MINRIVLVGRLTKDPELRQATSGRAITSFTLAVDGRGKKADGTKDTRRVKDQLYQVYFTSLKIYLE